MNGQTDENTDELCQVDCREGRRQCIDGVLQDCDAPRPEKRSATVKTMIMTTGTRRRRTMRRSEVCEDGQCLRACSLSECSAGFECRDDNVCFHYLAIQIVHQNKSAASKRVTTNVSLIETVPLVIAVRTDFASQTHLLRQPLNDNGVTPPVGDPDAGTPVPVLPDARWVAKNHHRDSSVVHHR